jgi:hypothetical protein
MSRVRLRTAIVTIVAGSSLVLAFALTTSSPMMAMGGGPPSTITPGSPPGNNATFAYLSRQNSNACGLAPSGVMMMRPSARLQGSCCSAMNLTSYRRQVGGLSRFPNVPMILHDPYDVPVALAQRLLRYAETIQLDPEQKSTYDTAMSMTPNKAPCCCHCWRWDMTDGLAKYLIAQRHWGAAQVADVVALTNGCGGVWEPATTPTAA